MGNRTSTQSKAYQVKDDAEVKVTNAVGSGQPGGFAMALDGKLVAHGEKEVTITLGKGADLLYCELRIEFVIHDRRWEHNRLTATTVVTGGNKKLEIIHDQKGESGDSATYTTLVHFV